MFNKIIIIGRLGFPPSQKQTKTGNQMCVFSVAVNSGFGENEHTDWYNVTTFGKQAEYCLRSLSKGSLVCVTGTLQLVEYEGKNGQKKSNLSLTADSVKNVSQKSENSESKQKSQPKDEIQYDVGSVYYSSEETSEMDNVPF